MDSGGPLHVQREAPPAQVRAAADELHLTQAIKAAAHSLKEQFGKEVILLGGGSGLQLVQAADLREPCWEEPAEARPFILEPRLSDLVLMVGSQRIPAHSKPLCLHSGYFRAMCSMGGSETRDRVCRLHCPEPDHFIDLLQYLYTGQAPHQHIADQEVVPFLLNAAFFDCPSYVAGLVRGAMLSGKSGLLMDARLDNECLLPAARVELGQHVGLQPLATLKVLAHWCRRSEVRDIAAELSGWNVDCKDVLTTTYLASSDDPGMDVLRAALPFGFFASTVKAMATAVRDKEERLAEQQAENRALLQTWACTRCGELVSRATRDFQCVEVSCSHTGRYYTGYDAGWSCCSERRKKSQGCMTTKEKHAAHTDWPAPLGW